MADQEITVQDPSPEVSNLIHRHGLDHAPDAEEIQALTEGDYIARHGDLPDTREWSPPGEANDADTGSQAVIEVNHPYSFSDEMNQDPAAVSFANYMHKECEASGDVVYHALHWYLQLAEQQEQARESMDDRHMREAEKHFAGAKGQQIIQAARETMEDMPPGIADALTDCRLPNGVRIYNDPEFIKWLASLRNVRIPGVGAQYVQRDTKAANDARIKEIEGMMGTKVYINDPKIQQEYLDLVRRRGR